MKMGQIGSQILVAALSASGASAAFKLKFGMEPGTHPGRQFPCLGWLPLPPGSEALKLGSKDSDIAGKLKY